MILRKELQNGQKIYIDLKNDKLTYKAKNTQE